MLDVLKSLSFEVLCSSATTYRWRKWDLKPGPCDSKVWAFFLSSEWAWAVVWCFWLLASDSYCKKKKLLPHIARIQAGEGFQCWLSKATSPRSQVVLSCSLCSQPHCAHQLTFLIFKRCAASQILQADVTTPAFPGVSKLSTSFGWSRGTCSHLDQSLVRTAGDGSSDWLSPVEVPPGDEALKTFAWLASWGRGHPWTKSGFWQQGRPCRRVKMYDLGTSPSLWDNKEPSAQREGN